MISTKRPQLLSHAEVNELYSNPTFTKEERELYFNLNKEEMMVMSKLITNAL